MKKSIVGISILIIFTLGTFLLIIYIGSRDLSSNENVLLSILLTIASAVASWLISYYYSENNYKNAIEEVKNESQSNLRTYALKASEKVDTLSKELQKMSVYLQDEIDREYEDVEEKNLCREEIIKNVIYLTGTLKSINDNSLSDWEGVIKEELEKREEKENENRETLSNIVDTYDDIIENYKNIYLNEDINEELGQEIHGLNEKIDSIIKTINPNISPKAKRRKNLKEEVKNTCPNCNSEIIYKQRPLINSVKNFRCNNCNEEIIGRWNPGEGFTLDIPKIISEKIQCPHCKNINTIELNSKLHSTCDNKCPHCKNYYKITRRANNILIKKTSVIYGNDNKEKKYEITEELINEVKKILPEQPWPKGTHKDIAKKLNIHTNLARSIMDILIKRGDALVQIDGKLYMEKKNE